MATNLEKAQLEVIEARAALEKAEAELIKINTLTDEQQLATDLHEIYCNNKFSCAWSYENNVGWEGDDHKRYLERALNLMELNPDLTPKDFVNIIETARGW